MKKTVNTKYVYKFEDGTTADMSLSFYSLYMLKNKDKNLYERHNQIMARMSNQKGNSVDEIDMVLLLYTAYVCGNLNDYENIMSEEDFIIKCGSNRMAVGEAYKALFQVKN